MLNNKQKIIEERSSSFENGFDSVFDIILITGDKIEFNSIEVSPPVTKIKSSFSIPIILSTQEKCTLVINLISNKQVVFSDDIVRNTVSSK